VEPSGTRRWDFLGISLDGGTQQLEVSMDQELLIQQTQVESQGLEHITRALQVMLGWTVQDDGFSRKLSGMRFFTELELSPLNHLSLDYVALNPVATASPGYKR
jgi:hypothetical protein